VTVNDHVLKQASIKAADGSLVDQYPVRVGIRALSWGTTGISLNGKPLYIRGCGKHEDSDVSSCQLR
jgi:beta-glucuronidase